MTVLTYLKRIFYVKDYNELSEEDQSKLPDQEALNFFQTDPDAYRRRVQECVRESQRSIYLNDPGCTINFQKEDISHQVLRDLMKKRFCDDDNSAASPGDISKVVTKEETLEIIQKAEKLPRGIELSHEMRV